MSAQLIADATAILPGRFIVNAIVAIHLLVIGVDFYGAISITANRFPVTRLLCWQRIYLAVVFGKSLSLILLDSCPLTVAENFFRRRSKVDTAYNDSFVSHYVPNLPSEIDLLLTCLLMLAGLVAVFRFSHQQTTTTING